MASLPPDLVITLPSVTLLTGPSGSGKSQTIPLLLECLEEAPAPSRPLADRTKPLVEWWPIDPRETIRRLTSVGLSDPFTWCRTYPELSAGQQARADLVDLVHGSSPLIVIDEFLSTLDRITARAVAWAAGRLIRRESRSLIVASANDDYADDLHPDYVIRLAWDAEAHVSEATPGQGSCSIIEGLKYRLGNRRDWNALKPLHYAAGDPATIHSIHALDIAATGHLAAVAVMSYPDLHSAARNVATNSVYALQHDPLAVHRLNREVLRLSRLVVTPELRGCRVAQTLVNHVTANTTARFIECTTALGRYSSFLEACGFREVPQSAGPAEAELLDWAVQERIPPTLALAPDALRDWVDGLSVRRARRGRSVVWAYYHHFVLHRRTRTLKPKKIADPDAPGWPEAWDMAARRLTERPSYWIIGPLSGAQEAPCEQTAKAS